MRQVLYPCRGISKTVFTLPFRPLSFHLQARYNSSSTSSQVKIDNAVDISHSHFISSASPRSDFNPTQQPTAGFEEHSHSEKKKWEGRLSPTTSHLFKLILPLPRHGQSQPQSVQDPKAGSPLPTAFLLHPSQPLSHLSRLIAGSLPPDKRDVEIQYLALTGQESDLETHLRHAEEEEEQLGRESNQTKNGGSKRQEGGPFLGERESGQGRWQEVSWSQSTDLSDFIKQSCLNERFKILIQQKNKEGNIQGKDKEMVLEVVIPSFESRTTYLRKRLLGLTKELGDMTKQKKAIDVQAHKGARKLIVGGLVAGVAYWIAVVRYTFFSDKGWDVLEPVTWTVGYGSLLASVAFLAYHNREVSYSSILDLSVTARQRSLYEKHGLDIDKWTEMVSEAKTLRSEIIRIAADYDIEWKGELENLASGSKRATIDKSTSTSSSSTSASGSEATSGVTSTTSASHDSASSEKQQLEDRREIREQKEEDRGEKEEPESEEEGEGEKIDIDKTIDEADELASRTEEQREKERAAQRKGEAVKDDGRKKSGLGGKRKSNEERGEEKAKKLVEQSQVRDD